MSARTVVRGLSLALGLALAAWALSDDDAIGGAPGFGLAQGVILGVGVLLGASALAPLRVNARALALVVSLGIFATVAEFVVAATVAPHFRGVSEYDDDVIYRLVPGEWRVYRRAAANGGDRIAYRVNEDGYRGEELESDPPVRVVVYGDSFIHAEYTRLEDTYTERLEHHLREGTGRAVEVVNAGVAGYGPDQVLRRMERELADLDPDLVIVAIFSGNDFGDLMRNKLYRLGPDGALVANPVDLEPKLKRKLDVQRNELVLRRIADESAKRLLEWVGARDPKTDAVAALAPTERVERFADQHEREYEQYLVEGDPVIRELAWDSFDADVALRPDTASTRARIALMDAIVARMSEVTRALGVPLVLVPIPHPVDVGGHETVAIDRERYPDYEPRRLVALIEGIGERHGVPSVDLFGPFRAEGSEALYFRGGDDHWNETGQDVAAQVTAGFLTERRLLGAPGA